MISTDELLQALGQLSREQIVGLLSQHDTPRSPLRERQLTDLTLKPSATDPRPTFFQETDGREFHPIQHRPYPALLWHRDTGQEITVRSDLERTARGEMWVSTPPTMTPSDPETIARKMFEALSPDDQAFIVEHQRQMRLEAVKKAMAGLSDAQSEAILAILKGNKH